MKRSVFRPYLKRLRKSISWWLAIVAPLVLLSACSDARPRPHLGLSHIPQEGFTADVFVIDTRKSQIHICGRNAHAPSVGNFIALHDSLEKSRMELVFATNGGMFQNDFNPVGLLVEDGKVEHLINLDKGAGNFFMMPNGVFAVLEKGKVEIQPSEKYSQSRSDVRVATQSGPMLVIDGKINPAFNKTSVNQFIRSGVGVIDRNTVVFAISSRPINFWSFARLFSETLKCKNALYLDGAISSFYLPGSSVSADNREFGVLIGVTKK